MNISAFGITHIGGSKNKVNQDTFFVGDGRYGVFDGHGFHGTSCAAAARDVLTCPDATFAEADAAACSGAESGGGTTATVLQLNRETGAAEVSHVGDSDVRFYDGDGEGVALTADHSPSSVDEFKLYRAKGATGLFQYAKYNRGDSPRPIFTLDASGEPIKNPTGYYYSTVRNEWAAYVEDSDTHGTLAMTRALGDIDFKRIGVNAEPSVLTAPPLPSGQVRAYIMASDGLWDIMHYASVGAILRRPDLIGNAEAAANAVLTEALAQQRALLGSGGDNTTVIVIYVTKS